MKKTGTLFLVITVMVSACSNSEQSPVPSETHTIVGSWRYEYPTKPCADTYEFAADNSVVIRSADEVVAGNYSFQDTVPKGERHSLIFSITADNRLPDCEGSTADHVGFTNHVFVEFYAADRIGWYPDHVSQQPTIILEQTR